MSVSVEVRDECYILRLRGLNTRKQGELSEAFEEALAADRVPHLIVDLAGIVSCSSTMINCLVQARKRVKERKGTMQLCSMTAPMHEKFRLLSLDRVFTIVASSDSPLMNE